MRPLVGKIVKTLNFFKFHVNKYPNSFQMIPLLRFIMGFIRGYLADLDQGGRHFFGHQGALNGGRKNWNPDIPRIGDPSRAQNTNRFTSTPNSPTGNTGREAGSACCLVDVFSQYCKKTVFLMNLRWAHANTIIPIFMKFGIMHI